MSLKKSYDHKKPHHKKGVHKKKNKRSRREKEGEMGLKDLRASMSKREGNSRPQKPEVISRGGENAPEL